jgi:hypothetical protein
MYLFVRSSKCDSADCLVDASILPAYFATSCYQQSRVHGNVTSALLDHCYLVLLSFWILLGHMSQYGHNPGSTLRVLYDFSAEDAGELSVSAGDIVTVASMAGNVAAAPLPEGWIFVANNVQRQGFVPIGV